MLFRIASPAVVAALLQGCVAQSQVGDSNPDNAAQNEKQQTDADCPTSSKDLFDSLSTAWNAFQQAKKDDRAALKDWQQIQRQEFAPQDPDANGDKNSEKKSDKKSHKKKSDADAQKKSDADTKSDSDAQNKSDADTQQKSDTDDTPTTSSKEDQLKDLATKYEAYQTAKTVKYTAMKAWRKQLKCLASWYVANTGGNIPGPSGHHKKSGDDQNPADDNQYVKCVKENHHLCQWGTWTPLYKKCNLGNYAGVRGKVKGKEDVAEFCKPYSKSQRGGSGDKNHDSEDGNQPAENL